MCYLKTRKQKFRLCANIIAQMYFPLSSLFRLGEQLELVTGPSPASPYLSRTYHITRADGCFLTSFTHASQRRMDMTFTLTHISS